MTLMEHIANLTELQAHSGMRHAEAEGITDIFPLKMKSTSTAATVTVINAAGTVNIRQAAGYI